MTQRVTLTRTELKRLIGEAVSEAIQANPPKYAVGPKEAAKMLGVSRSYFDAHILPRLKYRRQGGRILIPTRELERFLLS